MHCSSLKQPAISQNIEKWKQTVQKIKHGNRLCSGFPTHTAIRSSLMFQYTKQQKTKLKLSIFYLLEDDIANVFFRIKIA